MSRYKVEGIFFNYIHQVTCGKDWIFRKKIKTTDGSLCKATAYKILRNSTKKMQLGKSDKDWKTMQEAGKTIKEMTAKHR